MKLSSNRFKQALRDGQAQIGLWQGLSSAYATDLCAGLGYDWLLLDGEHAPNNVQSILLQLQAVAGHQVAPVVRPNWNDPVLFKMLLDIGVQNFLVPMIQNEHEAAQAAAALRYPPEGTRGVGTALARAARWGQTEDYLERANDEVCLLCQVETVQAVEQLDAILAVPGVDGVFIGPADLAASMGYLTQPGHPEVRALIDDLILRIRRAGKAPGILQADPDTAKHYLELGAQFVAVGLDTVLLRRAATQLLAQFRSEVTLAPVKAGQVY